MELDLNPSKINQRNSLNQWRILAHLLSVFCFDPELKALLLAQYNRQISQKTIAFLDAATPPYNEHLFTILKITFLPQVLLALTSENYVDPLADYHQVVL